MNNMNKYTTEYLAYEEEYMLDHESDADVPDSWEDYITDDEVETTPSPIVPVPRILPIPLPVISTAAPTPVQPTPEPISEPALPISSCWGSETIEVSTLPTLDDQEYPPLGAPAPTPAQVPTRPVKRRRVRKRPNKPTPTPSNPYAVLTETPTPVQKVVKPVEKKRVRGQNLTRDYILSPLEQAERKERERTEAFTALANKQSMAMHLTRTRMCRYGAKCNRKSTCTFAHNKSELRPVRCRFGSSCRRMKTCTFVH